MTSKKMVARRKDPLVGMRKEQLLRHYKIAGYIRDAEIQAVDAYVECLRITDSIERLGLIERYEDLPDEQKKEYDRVLELAERFEHINPLVDLVNDMQDTIPKDDTG